MNTAHRATRMRHDPLMKLVVRRCSESGEALASQSTISRLENAPCKTEAAQSAKCVPCWFFVWSYVGSSETSTRLTIKRSIMRRFPVVTQDPVTLMAIGVRSRSIAVTR